MMSQAFYTGVSGIKSHQSSMDVVSDNISNISTVGFRGYTTEFSSLFEKMVHTTSGSSTVNSTVGLGTNVCAISMDESAGTYQLSDRSTDLAIFGDGWFGVQGRGENYYTRDGGFSFNADGELTTADGYYVLGTMGSNINGDILNKTLSEVELGSVNKQGKLTFPQNLTFEVQPTTTVSFFANLGLEDVPQSVGATIIDSNNNKNFLKLDFTKTVPQTLPGAQWDVVATTTNLDGTLTYSTKSGVVNFSDSGSFVSSTLTSIDNNGDAVDVDFGSGYDGLVVSNAVTTASSIADGKLAGELLGYDINQNADIIATFSNGVQSAVGKIAVYHFQNDRGLERSGGSRFSQSYNSGEPIFFQDASGKNIIGAEISNFTLEGSNVKMEVALTEMIIMQRSFDANSKIIKAADEMLQKALNMRR